jgi:hypothetical protein
VAARPANTVRNCIYRQQHGAQLLHANVTAYITLRDNDQQQSQLANLSSKLDHDYTRQRISRTTNSLSSMRNSTRNQAEEGSLDSQWLSDTKLKIGRIRFTHLNSLYYCKLKIGRIRLTHLNSLYYCLKIITYI